MNQLSADPKHYNRSGYYGRRYTTGTTASFASDVTIPTPHRHARRITIASGLVEIVQADGSSLILFAGTWDHEIAGLTAGGTTSTDFVVQW